MMEAMNVFKDKSTSVKDPEARQGEVLAALGRELAKYLEEKISFHVPKTQPTLLREALKYYIKTNTQEDLIEEFYREIQRETTIKSSTAEEKLPWACHASTHRLVKDLVAYDATLESHTFSETIAAKIGRAHV